jgi:hypothetical protein
MHLERIYLQKCEYVGEPAIRELIQKAFTLAEEHIFYAGGGLALFSALMFFLGHECFTDPQFPWTENILHDDVDDTEKTHLLYSKMKEHIENVMLG